MLFFSIAISLISTFMGVFMTLTSKNTLEDPQDGEVNLEQAINSITAALKTTTGSIRGYYATETGKLLKVWKVDENGKTNSFKA